MFVKTRFLKNDTAVGKEYTYKCNDDVKVGDVVKAQPDGGMAVITEINVPEKEVYSYKDKLKEVRKVD